MLQQGLSSPIIDFCAAGIIVGLLTYARIRIKNSELTAGNFTSFIIAMIMLLEPLKRLVGIYNIFQQALGASQKVFEYLDHQREHRRHARRRKASPRFTRDIVFEDVALPLPRRPRRLPLPRPQPAR